jgi:hypothetical protein
MEKFSNLRIVERLLELSKNPMEYSVFPKECRKEYIFLSNVLNDALNCAEHEAEKSFKQAVQYYKNSLDDGSEYGWFHKPEDLVWNYNKIDQITYAIYGEKHIRNIVWNDQLGKGAYKDLIEQIDKTVIMSEKEKKDHYKAISRISKELVKEILKNSNK